MYYEVFIGVGGNMGNRLQSVETALQSLKLILTGFKCSSLYITSPRDYEDQDFFLNCVVCGKTELNPDELLIETQRIEREGGRQRNGKLIKGPRTIDLDILLYGDLIHSSDLLIIPHPLMQERRFVLIPLIELAPDKIDPSNNHFYRSYLEEIEEQGVYCYSLLDYNNLFS